MQEEGRAGETPAEAAGAERPAGDAGGVAGGGDGTVEAGAPAEAAKKKSRPRLTLRADVMERLKNIAAVREMSASDLADELLGNYLSAVPDGDGAAGGDATGGSEGSGSAAGGGRGE